MERVDHVVEAELDGRGDQFVPSDRTGAEFATCLEKPTGRRSRLLGRAGEVVHNVPGERFGQIGQADRRLARGAQFDQTLREGEFVRGDILAEEDHSAPVIRDGALMGQEVGHGQGVL